MHRQRLTWAQRGQLWLRLGIRVIGAFVAVLLVWRLGQRLLSLFLPFLLALALAAGLDPLVCRLQGWLKVSRKLLTLATLVVLLGFLGVTLGLLGRGAVRELGDLAENWDSLVLPLRQGVGRAEKLAHTLLAQLPGETERLLESPAGKWRTWLERAVLDPARMTAFATEKARELASFAISFTVFLLASYFLCADYPRLRERTERRTRAGLWQVPNQIRRVAVAAFGGYLKAQLLLSLGVFTLLLVGFALLRQRYALLLALGLAVLDFIPLLGAGTVLVPWVAVDVLLGHYSHGIAIGALWCVVSLFRRLAEPKVVGDRTGLSAIGALISIYVGLRLGGILGMLLGPVLVLVARNLCELGLLDGFWADMSLAGRDIASILDGWRQRNL